MIADLAPRLYRSKTNTAEINLVPEISVSTQIVETDFCDVKVEITNPGAEGMHHLYIPGLGRYFDTKDYKEQRSELVSALGDHGENNGKLVSLEPARPIRNLKTVGHVFASAMKSAGIEQFNGVAHSVGTLKLLSTAAESKGSINAAALYACLDGSADGHMVRAGARLFNPFHKGETENGNPTGSVKTLEEKLGWLADTSKKPGYSSADLKIIIAGYTDFLDQLRKIDPSTAMTFFSSVDGDPVSNPQSTSALIRMMGWGPNVQSVGVQGIGHEWGGHKTELARLASRAINKENFHHTISVYSAKALAATAERAISLPQGLAVA